MDARLCTSGEALEACAKVCQLLEPLTQRERIRVLLLVALDFGPQFLSDEALLRLCHAAQSEAPPLHKARARPPTDEDAQEEERA